MSQPSTWAKTFFLFMLLSYATVGCLSKNEGPSTASVKSASAAEYRCHVDYIEVVDLNDSSKDKIIETKYGQFKVGADSTRTFMGLNNNVMVDVALNKKSGQVSIHIHGFSNGFGSTTYYDSTAMTLKSEIDYLESGKQFLYRTQCGVGISIGN